MISFHLKYQKCLVGLDNILDKTWDIANDVSSSEKERLQAVSIGMQAYGMKIDLLTSCTVMERAVQFVGNYRSNILCPPQSGQHRTYV
jgi:hypothetical protein